MQRWIADRRNQREASPPNQVHVDHTLYSTRLLTLVRQLVIDMMRSNETLWANRDKLY